MTQAATATASTRKKTRLFMVGAFVVAGIAFAIIAASGINENLVYYWTPTDLHGAGEKAFGATIRLGGMVAPGSIVRKGGGSGIEFDVKDAAGVVHVKSNGVPPQMFRENIGVVVEGTMFHGPTGNWFQSNRLMVSHNNEYRAPAKGHPVDKKELEKLMKSMDEGK
ncbi:MAG TPA: cytochrome c maturation protein CcmE [Thermoanaerobaculia bacterium]|nr:cytochrome c maturation protein CcmE [Thermoanaerobaculia bacterium]